MPNGWLEEGIDKPFKGEATMRHQGLPRRIHFTEALRFSIGHKHRVITEAACASWRPGQMPIDSAFVKMDFAIGPGHAQRAIEIGAALLRCCGAKCLQLFLNQAHRHGPVPLRPRPVRRVNPGLAIQCVNTKAGIIGQRYQA